MRKSPVTLNYTPNNGHSKKSPLFGVFYVLFLEPRL